jgi:membrane-bound lytic murein transglycosylase D
VKISFSVIIVQMKKTIFILIMLLSCKAFAEINTKYFPVDDFMRERVNFWKKVYTEISDQYGYIHDKDVPQLIYSTVQLGNGSQRDVIRVVRAEKLRVKNLLNSIAAKNNQNLTNDEKALLKIIGENKSSNDIRKMANEIRFQRGMSNRYFDGLVRSYRYLQYIIDEFEKNNLPVELAFMPHVESSFNYEAYSKVGAAGIWQFMRSSARYYKLKMDYLIDERRDPILSTKAAINHLVDNYQKLKTWPLAVTAYNHGPASIMRAVRDVETTDLSKIIQEYDGKRFGFASKNFYPTFVAAVEIAQSPQKHFKDFVVPPPLRYGSLVLPKAIKINEVLKIIELDKSVFREYNRSLRKSSISGNATLPKGFVINLPEERMQKQSEYLAKMGIQKSTPVYKETFDTHKVARGENLYLISKSYNSTLSQMIAFNNLSKPYNIYPGMTLVIPPNGNSENSKKKLKKNQKESQSL